MKCNDSLSRAGHFNSPVVACILSISFILFALQCKALKTIETVTRYEIGLNELLQLKDQLKAFRSSPAHGRELLTLEQRAFEAEESCRQERLWL